MAKTAKRQNRTGTFGGGTESRRGKEIKLNGTSRTDAGVHALGQCASFRGEFGIPTDRIMLAANNILAGGRQPLKGIGDVRITSLRENAAGFPRKVQLPRKKIPLSDPQSAGTGYFSQKLLLSSSAAVGHRVDARGGGLYRRNT